MDLALNNLQRLICHKTQQTNQTMKPYCVQIISFRSKCLKLYKFVQTNDYKQTNKKNV